MLTDNKDNKKNNNKKNMPLSELFPLTATSQAAPKAFTSTRGLHREKYPFHDVLHAATAAAAAVIFPAGGTQSACV